MLLFLGHAHDPISSCNKAIPMNVDMPPICAIGPSSNVDYRYQDASLTTSHHYNVITGQMPPAMDVASKVGAPLKRTSTGSKRHSGSTSSSKHSTQAAIMNNKYKTEMCDKFAAGDCPYGDKCHYAHGEQELQFRSRHPKYRTELCRNFHTTGCCNYGPRCDYIHNEPVPTQHKSPSQPPMVSHFVFTPPVIGPAPYRRRSGTIRMPPLTIPTNTDTIGQSTQGFRQYKQHQSIGGLGSLSGGSSNHSCLSCGDSPPPSSCSFEHSPISYSPDILTNGIDYYNNATHWSPMVKQQQSPLSNNGGDALFTNLAPGIDCTANDGQIFTFSNDSMTNPANYGQLDQYSPNPHQPGDLNQLTLNLERLGLYRQKSCSGNFADNGIIGNQQLPRNANHQQLTRNPWNGREESIQEGANQVQSWNLWDEGAGHAGGKYWNGGGNCGDKNLNGGGNGDGGNGWPTAGGPEMPHAWNPWDPNGQRMVMTNPNADPHCWNYGTMENPCFGRGEWEQGQFVF